MNLTGSNLLLIKVTSRQDYSDQFLNGDLYCNRLSCFRMLEDDDQRGDSFEATMVYPPGSILTLENTNLLTSEKNVWTIPPTDLADNIRLRPDAPNHLNVFCMYAVDFNDLKRTPNDDTKVTVELTEKLWDFGDYAVIVFNVPTFIQRVEKEVLARRYKAMLGRVVYYDPMIGLPDVPLNESLAFFKRNRFAYQKEFRFVFNTSIIGNNAITVSIGDISDIAFPANKDNIHQELLMDVTTEPTPHSPKA